MKIRIKRENGRSCKGSLRSFPYYYFYVHSWPAHQGTAVAHWLRCCATNPKVAGSFPDGVIGIFHWQNPSDRTMALRSIQPLTEMSTRRISWGKCGRCVRLTTLPPFGVVMKSGNLNTHTHTKTKHTNTHTNTTHNTQTQHTNIHKHNTQTQTTNQDLNYICGHILPTITFYHNDILLCCILSNQ